MESMSHLSADLIATGAALVFPLLAFGVIMVITRSRAGLSAAIAIAATGFSALVAVALLIKHWQMTAPLVFQTTWMASGKMAIPIGVQLDPLSLLMFSVVAVICLLVQVYSLGYMAGDPGFGRYYGFMALFAWAMLTLTVSSSLLQLYIFWELVGLASYLLIGFWFEKFSASEAGKKAFVMTRTGDVAFLLGIVLLWLQLGTLDIPVLNDPTAVGRQLSPGMITLTALLIFGGIAGKSAQFPLLTWLPDAMEGPTPVSALLHSATMVAAGVYLFARLFGFFSLSPTAMGVCLAIGTISMLIASTMAMVARDIKQVWAYSTISQLGFMLMGLGAGSLFAGVFHLTTHAGFKALLFLCAGVFIHHFDSNDMFEIGRQGGRRLKTAVIGLLVGAGALSGLPPLAGFFSKELILGHLLDSGHYLAFLAAAVGAFLTTYYSFRLIFIILCPRESADPATEPGHGGHHRVGGELAMAAVLWVLTGATVVLGLFQAPLQAFLLRFNESTGAAVHHLWLPVAACTVAAVAIFQAWFEFGRKHAPQIGWVERIPFLADLFGSRWYLDRLYRYLLDIVVYRGVSRLFTANDQRVIDGAVDGLGRSTVGLGKVVAWLHNGMIQYRLMVMFAAVVGLILFLGWGG
ncbi:MAG: NADH-quinone oxidoreductase subunit L [Desulfosarcina sp.]|jgi:NADH-quinone oxidoreductase subunit L